MRIALRMIAVLSLLVVIGPVAGAQDHHPEPATTELSTTGGDTVSCAAVATPESAELEEALEGDVAPAGVPLNPCIDQCRDDYDQCLDDCVSGPYPGCENDCRSFLYACYATCF